MTPSALNTKYIFMTPKCSSILYLEKFDSAPKCKDTSSIVMYTNTQTTHNFQILDFPDNGQ